jgi:hypothetical protein
MPRSLLDLCITESADVSLQLPDGQSCEVLRVLSWRADAMGTARTEAFAIPVGESTADGTPSLPAAEPTPMKHDAGSVPTNPLAEISGTKITGTKITGS